MPGLVVAYALLAAGGYLWLRWRDRTEMLAEHAVGRHGALAAVAVGTATAFAFYGLGRLAARYVPAFAALEATLAGLLGTLRERQAVVVALTSGAAEEFFFRGAMQDALGWTITTVAFALSNYGGPRLRLWCVPAGLLGAVLGGLVIAGFGLLSAALAHALFNYLWLQRWVVR